jgi:hypothetical protein
MISPHTFVSAQRSSAVDTLAIEIECRFVFHWQVRFSIQFQLLMSAERKSSFFNIQRKHEKTFNVRFPRFSRDCPLSSTGTCV